MNEHYLMVDDVAKRLRVSRVTVYTFINSGKLDSVKLGKSRRIALSALQRFIDASKVRSSDREAAAAGHDNPASS